MPRLSDRIADTLEGEAAALAARWVERARAATARVPSRTSAAEATSAARAELVVKTIGTMLRNGGHWRDALADAGWALGAAERAAGISLHQLLRELEVLGAIVLHAAERCAEAVERADAGARPGGVADGLRLARRLREGFALVTLSAAEGWVRRLLETSREDMRMLRHDLRNPLGTVRSALALMDDETLPAETRADPRYRAMALRNATALDAMIRRRLGDAALRDWVRAWPEVSLADLALAVRRDLREEAESRACDVIVGDGLPVVRADSAALELVLGAALSALLRRAAPASRIAVELSALRDGAAVVAISLTSPDDRPGHPTTTMHDAAAAALDATRELSARAGTRVWADAALFVEVPVSALEPRDDLAGARQGDDA